MSTLAQKTNRQRAILKTALIVAVIFAVVASLVHFVSGQQLDALKHSLDLWTIVALVIIINLVSFACFLMLFAAYQWVRDDLKPKKDDDFKA